MEKFDSTEALLAWIVDFFSINFGNSAILKGGMTLRLMHSPRYTNDVDYIFIPFDSKKDAKGIIEEALSKIDGLQYQTTMNSKALRILIAYGGRPVFCGLWNQACLSHTRLRHGTNAN